MTSSVMKAMSRSARATAGEPEPWARCAERRRFDGLIDQPVDVGEPIHEPRHHHLAWQGLLRKLAQSRRHLLPIPFAVILQHGDQAVFLRSGGAQILLHARSGAWDYECPLVEAQDLTECVV